MRYRADRCTYCGQCVVACRFKCLELSHEEWELAALTKEPFTVYYGRSEDITAYQGAAQENGEEE
jgi:formate hydrogenlyase subunit 6/NADH:ubiquinone oxidoreductase subunit I